ncbi:MAG: arsenic transporter [Bryobacteraceae bacterium]|jgi:arsenical pump membrane protein
MAAVAVWLIAAAAILAILVRPRGWPEAVWACAGAVALVLFRLFPLSRSLAAVGKGTDVYLFLAGMMLLAEMARAEGVFEWLAALSVARARASRAHLFALVYGVGVLVTTFLSNDATAIVLTPAVYAAIRRARVEPLPYLLACAFIANAASFVLPISNPANLVVYGSHLPPLGEWLKLFILPSLVSIAATWAVLRLLFRDQLNGRMESASAVVPLSPAGRRAAWGIAATGCVLIVASALGQDLGLPTCLAAIAAVLTATQARGLASLVRGISWSVLPLVAGLFVLVEAVESFGGLNLAKDGLVRLALLPAAAGSLAASFGMALLSNLINNLPSGLIAGGALANVQVPDHIRHAVLIGVDLGPNLSVTGSLATILWLVALRREGERISARSFLATGAIVMPVALLLSTLTLLVTAR